MIIIIVVIVIMLIYFEIGLSLQTSFWHQSLPNLNIKKLKAWELYGIEKKTQKHRALLNIKVIV